jgi:hypothetical protein
MKKFTFLFLLALAFAGCTTEDDANVPEGLLKRVHMMPFVGEDEYTSRYYYDGHKLERIESSNGAREIYYYDGDLIVNIKNYQDTDFVAERQFQYDASGRLAQSRRFNNMHGSGNKSVYVYNADGTVTASVYSLDAAGLETYAGTHQFFFSAGEVTHDIITDTNGFTQTNTYTYDDKLVPEHDITGFDKIRMFNPTGYKGIYHNIVNVTQTNSANSDVGTYTHVWQYNEAGAPTYFSFDGQGTIIIDGGSVEYFYK